MPNMMNLGIKARELAAMLMEHPDADVLMEDLSTGFTLYDVMGNDPEAKHVPLHRVRSVAVAYTDPDYDAINWDMDYRDEPAPPRYTRLVLRIRGVNTAELRD